MPTLQENFTYLGDAQTAPLKNISIEFTLPVFGYTIHDPQGDGTVDREIVDTETLTISQPLSSKQYRVVLGDEFALGKDDATFSLFQKYYLQLRQTNNLQNLVIGATVQYSTDDGYQLGEQPLEFIYFPKLDLATDRSDLTPFAAPLKQEFIAINKGAFLKLLQQLAAAKASLDEITLLEIISYLTDLRDDKLRPLKLSTAMNRQLVKLMGANSGDDAKKILDIIKMAFPSLYDFPLSVPGLEMLKIAGTFTIVTFDNSTVSKNDFLFYDLSAEFSVAGYAVLQTLHYNFGNNPQVQGSAAEFDFSANQLILRNRVVSPVRVEVKAFDGSVQWSNEYKANDPRLAQLDIEVPLQKPITLVPTDKDRIPDKNKKLRGQVLALSKKCPLKDLTIVIQAKSEGDTFWRIVGAATTDSAGNFSMPYPFGVFTDAEALVSATPDSPAPIWVTAVRDGNQTIADDFLYLLIKNADCADAGTEEDCDCDQPKTASRLPDQADLIGSKGYSQDLGGACVNLSTPNRTLSEFNYQAIVRISDPKVANYILKKVDVLQTGIGTVLASDISRAVSALDPAIRNPIFGRWYQSEKLRGAEAKVDAMHNITADASSADLETALTNIDAILYLFNIPVPQEPADVYPAFKSVVDAAKELKAHLKAALLPRVETHYELAGGTDKRERKSVDLDNPVRWRDDDQHLTLYQAVTVATGHLLHYKAEFKADGYSLGELLYSLPLAPGQKKEIVVFDASHTLTGTETQSLSQAERLTAGIVDERDITNQLGGSIRERLRGSSSANTSGISAGFGTGGQGYGGSGNGTGYGGSGSAVLGVAGGVANANSTAEQDSSRDVSQYFFEKLRRSIMQNADSYRQLNASVVTTVKEGQQYGVTSEVVANHNHCHALTMMYFEVLRHYAIFQRLSSVEECVFVPLLMTNFTKDNIYKWRDVLAQFLLPMPSETYLQASGSMVYSSQQHPLLKAFDANERIKTNYANVDYPEGSYDDETIQFIRGTIRIRVELPRPRTRFDRIMSLPITTQTFTTKEIDPEATAAANLDFARRMAEYSAKQAAIAPLTFGLSLIVDPPPKPPGLQYTTTQHEVLVRQAVFDAFMSLDANYQSVPPAECIRVVNFKPPATISIGPLGSITPTFTALDFFADNEEDKKQWTIYANLLGYTDVLTMLNAYFKGNLISEWDTIFHTDIAPLVLEKIISRITLSEFSTDFSAETKYKGGERELRLNLTGTASKKRNQLPLELKLAVSDQNFKKLKEYITFSIEDMTISYSTAHYNGVLYSGNVNDDLFDDTALYIPENSEEKRNPRKEDAYLVHKLIEHLNSNLEYYNKVLWYNLDPDRRYMLLDGFNIQVYNDFGLPIDEYGHPLPPRSLASVVKNELITITGNSLVFPVAAGYKVSQSYIQQRTAADNAEVKRVSLLDHYKPLTPIEPYRISVPTRGVFAEAVQGACDACEKIETDRLQDWTKFPNTDEPTPISPITTPTPTVTDWRAVFKDFAPPLINIQNAPNAPEPGAGLAGLSDLLGKSGVFKDITGLDANQQNVLRTYLSNQENAKAFAEMAKEMAMQQHNTQNSGKIMDQIKSAKDSGAISQEDYGKLTKDHLQQQIDGGQTKKAEIAKEQQSAPNPLAKAWVDATGDGRGGAASIVDPAGGSQSYSVSPGKPVETLAENWKPVPIVKQQLDKYQNDCWACATAMLVGWNENRSISAEDAVMRAGQRYVVMYRQDTGLLPADKDDFLLRMQLRAEPPVGNGPQYYVDLLKRFGPLWITTDSVARAGVFSPHARILKKISGTGTADGVGTDFTFIDPATGLETTESFAKFIESFEGLVRDDASPTPMLQVVHFANEIGKKGEGYQIRGPFHINEPIHEMITLAALANSGIAIPDSDKYSENPIVNEYLRGVLWNDDPAILLFDEDRDSNWNFSFGVAWYARFKIAEHSNDVDYQNLTGRSHYFDLQFLHGMAPTLGEDPRRTLAQILLWAEVMYKVAIGDIAPSTRLADVNVVSSQTSGAAVYAYQLASFFDDKSSPKGSDTINYLLTQDTAYHGVDVRKRALGSMLHLVEDSYARGHVKRRVLNPTDLMAGEDLTFKPGKFGRFGEVENFHCYKGQDHDAHDKYDKPGLTPPNPRDLTTFNEILGARDAIEMCTKIIQMWQTVMPWDAPGGPKELLTDTIFKLSVAVTPADNTV